MVTDFGNLRDSKTYELNLKIILWVSESKFHGLPRACPAGLVFENFRRSLESFPTKSSFIENSKSDHAGAHFFEQNNFEYNRIFWALFISKILILLWRDEFAKWNQTWFKFSSFFSLGLFQELSSLLMQAYEINHWINKWKLLSDIRIWRKNYIMRII